MQEKTDLISIHVDVHRLRKTAPSQKPSIISCTIAKNFMTPLSPSLWTSEAYIKNLTLGCESELGKSMSSFQSNC